MKSSQQDGKQPVTTVLQIKGMNNALRSSIWNVLDLWIWQREDFLYSSYSGSGDIDAFANCYGASSSRSLSRHVQPIRESYLLLFASFFCGCEWYEVYDFLIRICSSAR